MGQALLVVFYGLFCIAVQTLLFREFVGAVDGTDLGVGLFFTAWFIWIAVGAGLTRYAGRLFFFSCRLPQFFVLLYLPATTLEFLLLLHFRQLVGLESYAQLTLFPLLFWSLVVCTPVSLLTGWLFPALSVWWDRQKPGGTASVYRYEAIGSLCGGVGVTLCLAYHVSLEVLLLGVFGLLCVGVVGSLLQKHSSVSGKGRWGLAGLAILCMIGGGLSFALGWDRDVALYRQQTKWTQLLPASAYQGSFQTDHAEYLYGDYQGQWVVMSKGSIVEALPDSGRDSVLAAMALSQNPGVRRVLVVGPSLGLCQGLLDLGRVETVDWFHLDRAYAEKMHARCQVPTGKTFTVLQSDIRESLTETASPYDLVIVNFSGQVGLATHRYYTVEFYRQIQSVLNDGGILLVTIPGSENVLGPEQAMMGGRTYSTLYEVYRAVLLVPGERTVFMATDLDYLDDEPGPLRDRFAALPGASKVYPPDALLSLYRPDFVQSVLSHYEHVLHNSEEDILHDDHPWFYQYRLLLAARYSDIDLLAWNQTFQILGLGLALLPLLCLVFAYGLYLWAHRVRAVRPNAWMDGTVLTSPILLFLGGWVAIGFVITFMMQFETRYGTLYLYVGLVSSLFMAGLALGSTVCQWILTRCHTIGGGGRVSWIFLLGLQCGLLWWLSQPNSIATYTPWLMSRTGMAVILLAMGLGAGTYFPWAAKLLKQQDIPASSIARRLEMADHLGAAIGGGIVSLFLIPFLTPRVCYQILAILLFSNILWELIRRIRVEAPGMMMQDILRRRRWGYGLFALALCIVLGWHWINLGMARADQQNHAVPTALQAWTDQREVKLQSALLEDGQEWFYHELYEDDNFIGYIVQTRDFAPKIYGFGGTLDLGLLVSPTGSLIDFRILRHYETPGYIRSLQPWFKSLIGQSLWGPSVLKDIDAVSGATYTSQAVMEILTHTGHRFAQVLGLDPGRKNAVVRTQPTSVDTKGLWFSACLALSLITIFWGCGRFRAIVLFVTLGVCGLWLNMQLSTEQIIALLAGRLPPPGWNGLFILAVGVPVLVLLFGNLYCGYLCPFGALQEWLNKLWPKAWRLTSAREQVQSLRFVKYILLCVVVVRFFLAGDRTLMTGDPLVWIFKQGGLAEAYQAVVQAEPWHRYALMIGGGAVILGILLRSRFWCRYLCPTGAFLSLFQHVKLFKRLHPQYVYSRCEHGLTGRDNLDCIACDGCRKPVPTEAVPLPIKQLKPNQRQQHWFMVILVVLAIVAWFSPLVLQTLKPVTTTMGQPPSSLRTRGRVRLIDEAQIREQINKGQLSFHEALYYRPINPDVNEHSHHRGMGYGI